MTGVGVGAAEVTGTADVVVTARGAAATEKARAVNKVKVGRIMMES